MLIFFIFLLQGTFSLIVEAWHEPSSARNSGNDNSILVLKYTFIYIFSCAHLALSYTR